MTFIDALNTPSIRSMIDSIDDLWVSLDRGERDDRFLISLLNNEVAKLAALGVNYDPRKI